MADLRDAHWRKSTRSGGNGGECVEVADNLVGVVAVRDSKDQAGPVLAFPPRAWSAFVSGVKTATLVH
ncbi:DUF397 domain-containing protein [Plantactinospora sp. S1510]|uniref:DUF397 domain-containing protein n=1 Tax=Plantactinospora alkalitolerans TaxID=2789879 RepID=A0ABS0GNX9_9ACTN|nr:DUF397 domain-containing protein [Plantactinospora alkalitolerans]MBF9127688.1 DUF397 domain-containing protein [Plantactinospora alkalitolerans]